MIYKNNEELQNLHIGENEIQRVLLGEHLIWENNKIIDLGWGKTWNIQNLFPNLYQDLTIDNFFLLGATQVSGSDTLVGTGEVSIYDGIQKSYNATTGVLSFNTYCNGTTGNVRAVMVSKVDKLTYVGFGTSFNVKNLFPNDYMNMTADNFLVKTMKHWNASSELSITYSYHGRRSYSGTWTADGTFRFYKSYNAETGILTVYFNSSGSASGVSDTWNRNSNCYVYASKKVAKPL